MIITLTKKVDAILAKKSRVTDCVQWDNTKQARMPYFHCGPFKKKKKKKKQNRKKKKKKRKVRGQQKFHQIESKKKSIQKKTLMMMTLMIKVRSNIDNKKD